MEINKFIFFALLCITCVTVSGRPASNGYLPNRENQQFNLEIKAPYPGDTVDLQFDLTGTPYITIDEKYWTSLPNGRDVTKPMMKNVAKTKSTTATSTTTTTTTTEKYIATQSILAYDTWSG